MSNAILCLFMLENKQTNKPCFQEKTLLMFCYFKELLLCIHSAMMKTKDYPISFEQSLQNSRTSPKPVQADILADILSLIN